MAVVKRTYTEVSECDVTVQWVYTNLLAWLVIRETMILIHNKVFMSTFECCHIKPEGVIYA